MFLSVQLFKRNKVSIQRKNQSLSSGFTVCWISSKSLQLTYYFEKKREIKILLQFYFIKRYNHGIIIKYYAISAAGKNAVYSNFDYICLFSVF